MCQALNSSDTAKVKRSRSQGQTKLCTKQRIYAINVIGQWKYTRLIRNRGRRSEWRRQIFFLLEGPEQLFLRMRSENMSKSLLTT